jgi:glycosyltransferase involved in cell wall biosynthesis
MAMAPGDPDVTARVRTAGWALVDPDATSRGIDGYRDFIRGSRGEFTVAKDIYVRPRSGWFSDRSVCYLAAGRPVVTQDTGFGRFVPTGAGLFAYDDMAGAVAALAQINADYPRHAAAARDVAREYFGADRVLRRLLADAGLG